MCRRPYDFLGDPELAACLAPVTSTRKAADPETTETESGVEVGQRGEVAFAVLVENAGSSGPALKVSGRFDALMADCPLAYASPNAPKPRALRPS